MSLHFEGSMMAAWRYALILPASCSEWPQNVFLVGTNLHFSCLLQILFHSSYFLISLRALLTSFLPSIPSLSTSSTHLSMTGSSLMRKASVSSLVRTICYLLNFVIKSTPRCSSSLHSLPILLRKFSSEAFLKTA